MELINLLEIKSHRGYRHFKSMKGDISMVDVPLDLMCVSAFKGGYHPTRGSVLGALNKNRNIDLLHLSERPELDLRATEHSFITRETGDANIRRILCIEMHGTARSLEDIFNSLLVTLYKAE